MPICSALCAGTVPVSQISLCGIATRQGGIHRLVFASCEVSFSDRTDLEEWTTFIQACKIRATGELVAQKPKGSYEKRRYSSCSPEQVSGGEKVLTFQDFNADNEDFTDIPFWNKILTETTRFRVGWFTCEGLFYGFYPFAIEVDEVIEDSRKGKAYKEGTITFDQIELFEPVFIPGLEALLIDNQNLVCPPED